MMSIFLSISFKHLFFGAQKNHLIEMVLLSTNDICFGIEIRKFVFISHPYLEAWYLQPLP